ncbi:MAG TPA: DUF1707 domain-containing protein [Streptosporangiaceae bacterium]|nr:DUF1707 domain-containing protein [Streptosporangiaceae bacterium]
MTQPQGDPLRSALPTLKGLVRYLQEASSRPGPQDLRASDADRDLVITLLSEAAGDGRLTLDEHSERSEKALSARTLGELARLTSDLAPPSGQPIRLYPSRSVSALFARERREGRWVVPSEFPVTTFFGDVVLDFRDAIWQSKRVVIYASAVAGQIKLIVPPGVGVEMGGRLTLGSRSVRGRRSGVPEEPKAIVEVRTKTFAGSVKVTTIRPPRRRRSAS